MKKSLLLTLLLVLGIGLCSNFYAQVNITIGTGTDVNTDTGAPAPYGTWYRSFHQQFLVLASEIEDAGGGQGNINSVAFNVSALNTCSPMANFTIRLKHTTQTTLSTNFEDGTYQTVFVQNDFMPIVGWNTHTFTTPFLWDGSSGILVDISTSVSADSYTRNASVFYTNTAFNSSLRSQSDSSDAITNPTGSTDTSRSNIRFNMPALVVTVPPNPAVLISPANAAINVMTSSTLNWASGGGAPTGYKVHFGTANPPPFVQNTIENAYTPTLGLNTQYFWKIVPFNAIGDAPNCPVWSFTTGGPIVLMNNGQQSIPDGTTYSFYDSGGPDGQYQNSENYTFTFSATTPTSIMHVLFTEFTLENNFDYLKIYDGPNTSAPQIGPVAGYSGSNMPEEIIGSNAVTFVFTSDGSVPYAGWAATVSAVNLVHDLGAQSLTGNLTPSVGIATHYNVVIKNNGANTETNYTVKLMSGTTQLVSIPGTTIAPQQVITFDVTWTPATMGALAIYGEVVVANDGIPANNRTPILNIAVQPAGVQAATIGAGDQNARIPMDFFYRGSLFECLYYSDELGFASGTITSLALYNNFTTNLPNGAIKVWLGTTNQADLSAGYIPSTELTLVFDGVVQFPSGINTVVIPLQTPYMHTPGNLVMMIKRPLDTQYYSSQDYFQCQTVGTNRARNQYSDSTDYDTTAPTGGTLSGQFPKATFFYTGQAIINDMGCLNITGNTTPSVGTASDYMVTVKNNGTAIQNNYQVKLFKQGDIEVGSVNGTTINPLQSLQVTVPWTPTETGQTFIYARVVLPDDEIATNNQTANYPVTVQAAGVVAVTIGAGGSTARMPMDFYWRNSLSESIYLTTELNIGGLLTGIQFYNNFVTNLPDKPTNIWVGETTQTDLSAGWIPSTQLTQVYNGTVTYPNGSNNVLIQFPAPYPYGGGNLVVMVERPMDTGYFSSSDNFVTQSGTLAARTLNLYSDSIDYDPASPAAATAVAIFPQTTFMFITGGMASLSGTVSSGGNPLAGVTISLTNTAMTQTTGANGSYTFPYLMPGNYAITATKLGYDTQTFNQVLTAEQVATQNFTMIPSITITVTGSVFGSDAPTVGLAEVAITLDGALDFTGTTNASGQFTITNVLSGNVYNYTLVQSGYQNLTGTITVAATNYSMGNLTMLEVAVPPYNILATPNAALTAVTLTWRTPGGASAGGVQDFEQNNGDWVSSGYGDWQWGNNYNVANYVDSDTYTDNPPSAAHSGTGMWGTVLMGGYSDSGAWSYLKKTVNLSGMVNPVLDLWHYMDGFNSYDYGIITVNGTTIWGSSAMAVFMPWQNLVVNLSAYAAQGTVEIGFEWFATTTVSYSGWYIDDLYIGPALGRTVNYTHSQLPSIPRAGSETADAALRAQQLPKTNQYSRTRDDSDRARIGYKVWRLTQGSENNETSWISLTTNTITDTVYVDPAWETLPDGLYKWAVKSIHTNGLNSPAGFSNMLPILHNDMAALTIQGNYTPSVAAPSIYNVLVKNIGTFTQQGTAYTVKLMSGTTELASMQGVTIAAGAEHMFPIPWTPATAGMMSIFGKVGLPGDSVPTNDVTPSFNISVQAAGTTMLTVGDGAQAARIPIDMFYKASVSQYLIYPAEIGNTIGQITGLGLNNQFTESLTGLPINIWIGTTTLTDLSAGWIPVTGMTQVFSGNMDFPTGTNLITFTFSNPYLYLDGQNLVITFERPLDGQYYSSADLFKVQTGTPSTRARNTYSDSTVYDLNAMSGGTNTGQFPQTMFYMIPGGVGDIQGTVTGPGNAPLEGVAVQLVNQGYTTTTNASGQYHLINVLPNDYTISFSKYGYVTHTQAISLAEDQELIVNTTLQPMATVNVTGSILASDTGLGINGAAIHLVGYADYTANSIATGAFTVPGVYANQSYNYTILAPGYSSATGSINVGATNHVMNSITLTEIAFAPGGVTAALNGPQTEALINWLAPDPNALDVTEGFEATVFPPLEWTQTILNTGAANSSGVFPTWCKFGTVTVAAETVLPTEGNSQAGLWWAYEHQDEWLISPGFAVPPNAYLSFDSYVFLGSTSGDHYYVKGSIDGGTNWTVLWDASAQTGGWNYYATPISIDLASYSGQQLKLAWHAVDPPSNDGMWYVWFIDDIYIGNATTRISFSAGDLTSRGTRSQGWQTTASNTHPSRAVENGMHLRESVLPQAPQTQASTRSLVGYKVWRLASGQEANPDSWTSLTPENITTISFTDAGWTDLANGNYRWAVKAAYTSNVISLASFSNVLLKEVVTGMISGVVRQGNNQPIPGATVTAGTHTATCNNSGAYVLIVPTGTYNVAAAKADYITGTVENVVVNANQTTTVNFILIPGSGIDDEMIPATITELVGNYPNPFNPSTTISYSVKDPAPVKLVIYNIKGQKVRTLVDRNQTNGRYNAVWNGKDDNNKAVGSGVYYYRMTAGKYISTRKMLLVE